MSSPRSTIVGRFAPTPSGPLHLGSLVAALGSWLDVRSRGGQWRLRVDDLDQARCRPERETLIPETLEAHGLFWDGAIVYQSARQARYDGALETLKRGGFLYPCVCTRRERLPGSGIYPGTCKDRLMQATAQSALRIRVPIAPIAFKDRNHGPITLRLPDFSGDFVVRRRDGVIAYHLATVVDDEDLAVTDVVRGGDLLPSTAQQLFLSDLLGFKRPQFLHLPVCFGADGRKLSKQNHAPALRLGNALLNLHTAMHTLQAAFKTPLPAMKDFESPHTLLAWATHAWSSRPHAWLRPPLLDTPLVEHD